MKLFKIFFVVAGLLFFLTSCRPSLGLWIKEARGENPLAIEIELVGSSSFQKFSNTEINWGDGTVNKNIDKFTHEYQKEGSYTIIVTAWSPEEGIKLVVERTITVPLP